MSTTISDMPALQAEDDGFLLNLKLTVIDKHLPTLGIEKLATIDDCVEKLLRDSEDCIDIGGSLPLYTPFRSDDGVVQGHRYQPVWAGKHIDVPLYGDMAPDEIEWLIYGGHMGGQKLHEDFLSYSPAFRVALLVHHIIQVVAIDPFIAELFVLGRYEELFPDEEHFKKFGVPPTELIQVGSTSALRTEWVAYSPEKSVGYTSAYPKINGWTVRIRGSQPKRELMLQAWQEVRERIDEPREVDYTFNGNHFRKQDVGASGATRKRVKDPGVTKLVDWINYTLKDGEFPMRGSRKDWQQALRMFERDHPIYAGRWLTGDAMRKVYEHHRLK